MQARIAELGNAIARENRDNLRIAQQQHREDRRSTWAFFKELSMRSHFDPSHHSDIKPAADDHRLTLCEYEQLARIERAQILGAMLAEGLVWCIRLPRRIYVGVRDAIAARRGEAAASSPAAE